MEDPVQADDVPLSHAERISRMNDPIDGLLLDDLVTAVLPGVIGTVVVLSILYNLSSFGVHWFIPADSDRASKRKVQYQITNFCMNTFFAILGVYYEIFVTRPLVRQYQLDHPSKVPSTLASRILAPYDPPIDVQDVLQGHLELQYLSFLQLGFQLWGIPMGLFFVKEPVSMLCHHVAVVLVTSMSACCTNGLRFWTPFFYGLMELSSVPLTIMNVFKDHPNWIQRYPDAYLGIRLLFAALFLHIRIFMCTPRFCNLLRDMFLLVSTSNVVSYQIFMTLVSLCVLFLLLLQYYWGSIIVKGLIKVAFRGRRGDDKGKMGTNNNSTANGHRTKQN